MNKIKVSKKTQFFFLIFGLFLATFLSFNIVFSIETDTEAGSGSYVTDCLKEAQYDIDDYFNYTGPTISLDGGFLHYRIWIQESHPHYNWSQWAANHSWCTGSGTPADPYVIENLYLDCQGYGGGICIRYSSAHFIIKNCWIEYGSSRNGIWVDVSENGNVSNNVVNYFQDCIKVDFSDNVNVTNNIMVLDKRVGSRGLMAEDTSNAVFFNNKVLNSYHGFFFSYGDNLIIDSNYLEDQLSEKGGTAIHLRNISYSDVTHNVFAGGFSYGIIRVTTIYSSQNIVSNNYVSYDQGLKFNFTTIQMSAGPQTSQEDPAAIELKGSHNNYIAYNVMLREGSGGGTDGIPGFNPFLILTAICVVAMILLKRHFKH